MRRFLWSTGHHCQLSVRANSQESQLRTHIPLNKIPSLHGVILQVPFAFTCLFLHAVPILPGFTCLRLPVGAVSPSVCIIQCCTRNFLSLSLSSLPSAFGLRSEICLSSDCLRYHRLGPGSSHTLVELQPSFSTLNTYYQPPPPQFGPHDPVKRMMLITLNWRGVSSYFACQQARVTHTRSSRTLGMACPMSHRSLAVLAVAVASGIDTQR
jgi:hypothetical protein